MEQHIPQVAEHAKHAGGFIGIMAQTASAKLATLNWLDLFTRLAPIALTTIIASFGIVAWYGSVQTAKITAVFDAKLETLSLESQRYCDRNREGRFTLQDFDREMSLRDGELKNIAQKQDDVRERLISELRAAIAELRADFERVSAEFRAYLRESRE